MLKNRECVKTRKTSGNAQFYVGAAVGITVGLCVGKLLSSATINKPHAPARKFTANISKDDGVSINGKKLNNVRSKSASRCEDRNSEGSALKAVSSDSKININSSTSEKQQSGKALPFRESHRVTQESDVSLTESTLKLDVRDIESVDGAFERASVDYLSDKEDTLKTNEATCNTIVDTDFGDDLTSARDQCESSDMQYNEFAQYSLLSSTKYDSIPF